MEDIYRYRAQMKMYGEDTTHAHGPQPKKYAKAEYRMLLAAATLDMHTEAITKNKGMKLAKNKVVPDLTIDSGMFIMCCPRCDWSTVLACLMMYF